MKKKGISVLSYCFVKKYVLDKVSLLFLMVYFFINWVYWKIIDTDSGKLAKLI